MFNQVLAFVRGLLMTLALVPAQGIAQPELSTVAKGQRHLVLTVGLPGDGDYRTRMAKAVEEIATAAPVALNIAAERIHCFLSDEEMVEQLKNALPSSKVCTASNVREFFAEQSKQWSADDSIWIVMIGHTQVIEGRSFYNVQGRDFWAEDLAGWMKPVACREQVTFLTMPASGAWLGPMRAAGRINIVATDSIGETTGTEYPFALAEILAGKQSTQALEDLDKDGRMSLLDLYLAVALEVHGYYTSMERLPTEHSQLDDNADGRGRELQEPLIPTDTEEDADVPKPSGQQLVITKNNDGAVAQALQLK